jgi:hypothetical protein
MISRLEKRIVDNGSKKCRPSFDQFKSAYSGSWRAVTGGSLYSGHSIEWDLWRRQEFAFASLEHAATELLKYLSTTS